MIELESKQFNLGGDTVTAKELTIGQFKKVQEILNANPDNPDEMGASTLMVSLATGLSVEEIEAYPAKAMVQIGEIATWLGDVTSPN